MSLRLAGAVASEFSLLDEAGPRIRVRAESDGWRVSGPGLLEGCRLRHRKEGAGGFVLDEAHGGAELARSMPLVGAGSECAVRYALLGDGRLFRIAPRCGARVRWELQGWETPGAYLVARPEDEGWRLTPTPAGADLEGMEALSVLLAAELLEAEAGAGATEGER